MKKRVLSKEDVLHLIKLSKLHLSQKELDKYWKQLEQTAEYVKNLDELNTSEVNPTSQTTNLTSVTFDDEKENLRSLTQAEILSNAKNKKKDYFIVKRIL